MKFLLLAAILSSSSAFACQDANSVVLKEGALAVYSGIAGFKSCLKKLEKKGVDVKKASAWRNDRADGDTNPIIYTITVQGSGEDGKQWRLRAGYNLKTHKFQCAAPTDKIPRCL